VLESPQIMQKVVAIGLLLACAVALTAWAQLDYVKPSNCGGHETGFFVWGKIQGQQLPTKETGGCGAAVSVGVVDVDTGKANQLAAFAKGKSPELLPVVNWDANATVPVAFSSPAQVKVKFWVLYASESCDIACTKTWVRGFLTWANQVMLTESAGIRFSSGDGAAVVSDQTTNTDPTVKEYVRVSVTTDCNASNLADLKKVLYESGMFNVYLVQKVGNSSSAGNICELPPPVKDMAFVADQADWGTMLHEIGHLLGLPHADELPGLDSTNLMWAYSDDRQYLTEGQVFWMHFADQSVLPTTLGVRSGLKRNCDGNVLAAKPCPRTEERIWPDP
jgi:hypothetical protein